MNILKKRILPLFLVFCVGASTVNTFAAGWQFWMKKPVKKTFFTKSLETVGSCFAGWQFWVKKPVKKTFFSKSLELVKKNKTITFSIMVLGALGAYVFYKILTRNNIESLTAACKGNDIEKAKEILEANKDRKDLGNWILYGKGEVVENEVIGENSPLHYVFENENYLDLRFVKLLVDKLDIDELAKKVSAGKLDLLPLFKRACQNKTYIVSSYSTINVGEIIFRDFYLKFKDKLFVEVKEEEREKAIKSFEDKLRLCLCENKKLDFLVEFGERLVSHVKSYDKSFYEQACKCGCLKFIEENFQDDIDEISGGKEETKKEIFKRLIDLTFENKQEKVSEYFIKKYGPLLGDFKFEGKPLFLHVLSKEGKDFSKEDIKALAASKC